MNTSIKLIPIRYCINMLSRRTAIRYISKGYVDQTFRLQSHFILTRIQDDVSSEMLELFKRGAAVKKKGDDFKDRDIDSSATFKCIARKIEAVKGSDEFDVLFDIFTDASCSPIAAECRLRRAPTFEEGCNVRVIGCVTSMRAGIGNQIVLSVSVSRITASHVDYIYYSSTPTRGSKVAKQQEIENRVKDVLSHDPNCPVHDLILITGCSLGCAEKMIKGVKGRAVKEDIKSLKDKEQKPVATKKPKGKHYLEVIREILTDNPDCKPSELMAMTGCTERCANSAIKGFKDEIEFTKDLYKVKPDRRY